MNWKEKANEIAERICTIEALEELEIGDYIQYDENGRLDIRYVRDGILPMVRDAVMEGMRAECDAWCKKIR